METRAPRFWGYLLISSMTPRVSSNSLEEGAWSSCVCASMTSQEAKMMVSKEKLLPTAPSEGHPFLSGQRQKYGQTLQAHPGSLVGGLLLLPCRTASSCPSYCTPPATASQYKPILSSIGLVNSIQPSDLSSAFISVPITVAMKCGLQNLLTQGNKHYFHRSMIQGLSLLHLASAREA